MGKKVSEMTREELIEYVKKLFLGWEGDEHTSPLDKFADDCEFEDVTRPVKKVFKGKKEIGEFLQCYAGMSGWKIEFLHVAVDGNRIGIEGIWYSVHDLGPYDGIPPRGKKTKIHGSSWLTINEDGKISQETDIWDRQSLIAQLCGE